MPQRGRAATPVSSCSQRGLCWVLLVLGRVADRCFAQAILFSWCQVHTRSTSIDLLVEPKLETLFCYDHRSYIHPLGTFR